MRAVVINEYGDANALKNTQLPRPVPSQGEVLVQVNAVGLNPVDYKIRDGHLVDVFPVQFPRVLGGDISGVVTELGKGATEFSVGDEVYFSNPLDRDGGYADYVSVEEKFLYRKPPSRSHTEAASLPVVALTAIQALRDFGGITNDSKVLIHGGSGGVGSFAVQYAKSLGATVYATASTSRLDYVKNLGADRVIDYKTEDFVEIAKAAGGMDIVLETVGGENYSRSIEATRDGGAVPSIVNPPDAATAAQAKARGIKTDFMLLRGEKEDLKLISELVESKTVQKPNIFKVLPLEEAKQAHELLQSGRAFGKIVLGVQ